MRYPVMNLGRPAPPAPHLGQASKCDSIASLLERYNCQWAEFREKYQPPPVRGGILPPDFTPPGPIKVREFPSTTKQFSFLYFSELTEFCDLIKKWEHAARGSDERQAIMDAFNYLISQRPASNREQIIQEIEDDCPSPAFFNALVNEARVYNAPEPYYPPEGRQPVPSVDWPKRQPMPYTPPPPPANRPPVPSEDIRRPQPAPIPTSGIPAYAPVPTGTGMPTMPTIPGGGPIPASPSVPTIQTPATTGLAPLPSVPFAPQAAAQPVATPSAMPSMPSMPPVAAAQPPPAMVPTQGAPGVQEAGAGPYSWNKAAGLPTSGAGGTPTCPEGQFWDGVQCRGAIGRMPSLPGGLAPSGGVAAPMDIPIPQGLTSAATLMGFRGNLFSQNAFLPQVRLRGGRA